MNQKLETFLTEIEASQDYCDTALELKVVLLKELRHLVSNVAPHEIAADIHKYLESLPVEERMVV